MGTPLDEIFDRFYSLIKDTDLAKLDDEDLYKLTKVYYEMASTRFKECKNNLELVQDSQGNYSIVGKLTVEEQNIIAQGMILYWIESKVNYNNEKVTKDSIVMYTGIFHKDKGIFEHGWAIYPNILTLLGFVQNAFIFFVKFICFFKI